MKKTTLSAGFPGFPHQWSGHSGLRLISEQTEVLPRRGEGGVRPSRRPAVRSLFLLQPLHDLCCLPGGGAGPAGEA